MKYLIKKFLKKTKLRDYLRVVAKTKDSYEMQFYNFGPSDTEEEEEN